MKFILIILAIIFFVKFLYELLKFTIKKFDLICDGELEEHIDGSYWCKKCKVKVWEK